MNSKKILFSMALLGMASFVNAQSMEDYPSSSSETLRKLSFGVYVSPTMSWMKPTAPKDGDQTQASGGSKLGLMYGLMADYNFTENYAIATGLQINSTGGIITTENTNAQDFGVLKSNIDYSLQFINIPLALKLRTDEINKFSFFGQAGLSMAINISKKATYDITQRRISAGDTVFKTDEKEKIEGGVGGIIPVLFEMNVGAGVQYAIGPKLDAYVAFFFNNGFAPNVTDPRKYKYLNEKGISSLSDGNTRLNNFSLRLGFYF